MKKTALHFRVAAWSIKNPLLFYSAIAAGLLVVVSGVLVGARLVQLQHVVQASYEKQPANVSNVTPEKNGWRTVRSERTHDGICVLYQHPENNTSITQCYTNVAGKWVFEMSY